MGASILTAADSVICPHGAGKVTTTPTQVFVKINGSPVLVVGDQGMIAGCPFQLPPVPKPSPCVTVQWLKGATMVRASGKFVLTQTASGLCKSPEQAPQGPPTPTAVQLFVSGL